MRRSAIPGTLCGWHETPDRRSAAPSYWVPLLLVLAGVPRVAIRSPSPLSVTLNSAKRRVPTVKASKNSPQVLDQMLERPGSTTAKSPALRAGPVNVARGESQFPYQAYLPVGSASTDGAAHHSALGFLYHGSEAETLGRALGIFTGPRCRYGGKDTTQC